jgi:phosphoenolpyruvate carboxylase
MEEKDAQDATERAERIRELNERTLEASRRAGAAYMDAYEEALRSMVEYQEKMAETSPAEWARSMIEAQADFAREMAKFYEASAKR